MQKTRKLAAILLALALVLGVCNACTPRADAPGESANAAAPAATAAAAASDSAAATDGGTKIGLILPGGRGDMSIVDALYNGVVAAQKTCEFTFDYAEVVNASDPEYFLREFCDSGEYDLIIVACFTFFDAMSTIPAEYPDQKFLVWDMAEVPYDENVMYGGFMHETTSFVAGAFVALMDPYGKVTVDGEEYAWTPSGKASVLTNGDDPLDMRASVGFESGAKYVNPDFEIARGFTGTYTDQSKAKELALSMYNSNVNFILMCSGGASYGIVEAAKELGGGRWAIGFDQNLNGVDTHVICSALNDTSGALASLITGVVRDGVFTGGEVKMFGYTTGNQALALRDGMAVPDEVKQKIETIIARVSSGEVAVPNNYDGLKAFTAVYED